jgi:hypothetical protein
MIASLRLSRLLALNFLILGIASGAFANAYRESGKLAKVGDSGIVVTPARDWNRLDLKPGKFAEVWTLDGEQLNDVTFYGGVVSGQPIVREHNKKRNPLPKFRSDALLIEIPELLEGTYRAYKRIGNFTLINSKPSQFLGQNGVHFSYDYTDQDGLPRKGEARAAIVSKKLYMVTFDAPRLHYFDRALADYRALADTARLTK